MLHKVQPREQNGRDSFSRYRAQIRSAAIASLSILEGKEIDWIYCDFQDDFVVRLNTEEGIFYRFYQVKTKSKQNQNWTLNEISGINSRQSLNNQKLTKIKDSFFSKLLLHTIIFEDACQAVVFQTNINHGNDVENFFEDIKENKFENKGTKFFLEKFNEIFDEYLSENIDIEKIKKNLKKLCSETDVEYLKEKKDIFEPLAKAKIYEFSEIELNHDECKEIILKLLDLIERKSSGVIKDINKESVEELAGICIKDLLEILSITYEAYQILLSNGDNAAIRSVSIIQRTLSESGASKDIIEYCSRCKSEWDIWLRNARHKYLEFDLQMIISRIRDILNNAIQFGNYLKLSELGSPIKKYFQELETEDNKFGLTQDLIVGGVFSELVKGKV